MRNASNDWAKAEYRRAVATRGQCFRRGVVFSLEAMLSLIAVLGVAVLVLSLAGGAKGSGGGTAGLYSLQLAGDLSAAAEKSGALDECFGGIEPVSCGVLNEIADGFSKNTGRQACVYSASPACAGSVGQCDFGSWRDGSVEVERVVPRRKHADPNSGGSAPFDDFCVVKFRVEN